MRIPTTKYHLPVLIYDIRIFLPVGLEPPSFYDTYNLESGVCEGPFVLL